MNLQVVRAGGGEDVQDRENGRPRARRSTVGAPSRVVVVGLLLLPVVSMGAAHVPSAEQASERAAEAGDAPAAWSRFRGPNGSGVSGAVNLPVEVGPDTNVLWETPLPAGHSSPILTARRIFLTAFEGDRLFTYCLDRDSGEILWRREAPRPRREKLDPRNSPASPSPASDGERVFVFFADFGILAYDLEGNELWRVPLGPFDNFYGMGASPILADDKVILVCDQNTGSFVVALSKEDGAVVWRTERPEARSSHATPILWQPDEGAAQLLVSGSFYLSAYSLESGERIWWVGGLCFEIKATPVISDGIIYINGYGAPENQPGRQIRVGTFEEALAAQDADGDGKLSRGEVQGTHAAGWIDFVDLGGDGTLDAEDWGYYRAALASTNGMLAIRLGGRGDMTENNIVWTYHRSVPQLPSPLVYEDVLYMVNDGGIVTSFDPATGEVLAQGRLEGAVDRYYTSPVAADGKIYFVSELGLVAVVEPGGSLDIIAVSDLDDMTYATPAIEDGRIYLRTRGTLYCFGLE